MNGLDSGCKTTLTGGYFLEAVHHHERFDPKQIHRNQRKGIEEKQEKLMWVLLSELILFSCRNHDLANLPQESARGPYVALKQQSTHLIY